MQNLISYLSDFMNFWTLIDVILISFFAALSLYFYKSNKPLSEKVKNYQFFSTCSAQTIEDYETQIHKQDEKIKGLKKAFEDAVSEITELRSKYKELIESEKSTVSKLKYWKERALHQKHTKTKQADSDWWECLEDKYKQFKKGEKYFKGGNHKNNDFILLRNSNGTFLAEKKYFRPVER